MSIKVKRVEIRDRATLVPAIALRLVGKDDPIIASAGFKESILLIHLTHMECQWDSFAWIGRTMYNAHHWLTSNWEKFEAGGVIDVEFVLGETDKPKKSQL